jgi:hypothetical protein
VANKLLSQLGEHHSDSVHIPIYHSSSKGDEENRDSSVLHSLKISSVHGLLESNNCALIVL